MNRTLAIRVLFCSSLFSSLFFDLHHRVFAGPFDGPTLVPIDVVAICVKGGKQECFVEQGTQVFFIGPLCGSPPEIVVTEVGEDGSITGLEAIPGSEYRILVNTLQEGTSLTEIYLPAATSIRVVDPDLGLRIVAEAISLKEFRSKELVQLQLLKALSMLETGSQADKSSNVLTAAKTEISMLVERVRDKLNVIPTNKLDNWEQLAKSGIRESPETVEIKGLAAVPDHDLKGELPIAQTWSPYKDVLVFGLAADGPEIGQFFNDGPVLTDELGRFRIKLPNDRCVRLVINAEFDSKTKELLKWPLYLDVFPSGKYPDTYDTHLTVNATDVKLSPAEQSNLFTKLMLDATSKTQVKEVQKRCLQAAEDLRSAVGRLPKVQIVSGLFGGTPNEAWQRVLQASTQYPQTGYWVIAKTSDAGPTAGWQKAFRAYTDAQFLDSPTSIPRNVTARSNFRIAGYVSLSTGSAAKPYAQVKSEIATWSTPRGQYVSGVFIDNLRLYSAAWRESLYDELKAAYGKDFTVFGACGPAVDPNDTEEMVAKFVDVLFIEKNSAANMMDLRNRQQRIASVNPTAKTGAFWLGVDDSSWTEILDANAGDSVQYFNVSDFTPRTVEETWFNASIPLPSYWDDLCKRVGELNSQAITKQGL